MKCKLLFPTDFRSFFNRLNFLPEYNELKPINEAIREESGFNENKDFKNVLTLISSSVAESDNAEVKSQTLSKVIQVIQL